MRKNADTKKTGMKKQERTNKGKDKNQYKIHET